MIEAAAIKGLQKDGETSNYISKGNATPGAVWRSLCCALERPISDAVSIQTFSVQPSITRSVYQGSVKLDECSRQLERIRTFKEWMKTIDLKDSERDWLLKSLKTASNIIECTVHTPAPIPIASATVGEGASLFINDGFLYGDIEIDGSEVEYFLKPSDKLSDEIYDVEETIEGRLPTKLLAALYMTYARNHNDQKLP